MRLPVGRVGRGLAGAAAFLVVMGIVVLYPKYIMGHDYVYGLVPKFDLNGEMNAPTWFSSSVMFVAALLLLYIAAMTRRERDRFAPHWVLLACVFLLMSLDETGGFHGLLSRPLREAFDLTGIFFHAWVIPIGVAVVILGVSNLRLVLSLQRPVRRQIILAGVFYVVGALGGEAAGGVFRTEVGVLGDDPPHSLSYGLLTAVEETFEIIGILLFTNALMHLIGQRWGGVRIDFQ